MEKSDNLDYQLYLNAKKAVDDRSLNPHVFTAFQKLALADQITRKPKFLEIGCGTGTMIERLSGKNILRNCDYFALDVDEKSLAHAKERLAKSITFKPHFICEDILDFSKKDKNKNQFDGLISHAFLDLIPIPVAIPELLRLLKPGGWFYFTILFDGTTDFFPEIDPKTDEVVISEYHSSMKEKKSGNLKFGTPFAGKQVLNTLLRLGASILETGSSDWAVFPRDNQYPDDEGGFLKSIILMVKNALVDSKTVSSRTLESWFQTRMEQIIRGELIFITHQIDILGKIHG